MREVHIRVPIFNGDRSQMFLSVANFRVTSKTTGLPHKGNILVYCDWKVHDKNNPDPNAMILMWRYPFIIKCSDVVRYPPSYVGEGYNRTKVHTIPVNDMKIYETKRKRIMTQDEWKALQQESLAVKQETE